MYICVICREENPNKNTKVCNKQSCKQKWKNMIDTEMQIKEKDYQERKLEKLNEEKCLA